MLYRAYFNLLANVLDLDEARLYLIEDDMTPFLKYDDRVSTELSKKIIKIEWILKTESSGHIDLTTEDFLSDEESAIISEWVNDQCADGLGGGFEQQDFACYYYNQTESWKNETQYSTRYGNDEDYDDGGDELITASFDWQTNEYPFILIN